MNHWKQPKSSKQTALMVVICFQISIFEPLETTAFTNVEAAYAL
ncbi:hypothetical protein BACDOR_03894 [Phocaeicola dorei DSM 17855]|uniref:Uncharacterized protein n=1 Tax=Phocaeicola dorei DSM 17855 TaxID=483217 RepID=B6W3K3_9BACT|nr:hypothetical protein BACDOR_03894 [Phocaeicola dorei DSM 17855]